MVDEGRKQPEIEELCRRIEALANAEHLSEEQKLSFARQALEIIINKDREEEVQ